MTHTQSHFPQPSISPDVNADKVGDAEDVISTDEQAKVGY